MWTERQLKLLEAGGNGKLFDYCEKYNLNKVDIKLKYQTRALVYYRRRNEAQALGRELNDPEPEIEEGRKLIDGSSVDKKPEEEKPVEVVTPENSDVPEEKIGSEP